MTHADNVIKAASTMAALLRESEDQFTFKNDNPEFNCYFDSKMFGVITIKDAIINFVDHKQWFDVNEHETSLNDFVAELSTY